MNGDACVPDRSQIARVILTYLEKNPEAQDTLDGIRQGWLLDRGNRYTPTLVQEVVKDLVLEGTILESKTPGSQTGYQFNLAKRNRLKESLKKKE